MRAYFKTCTLALALLCLAPTAGRSQDTASSDKSLADVARKVRAARGKETKPVKTFTNEDLTALGKEETNVPLASGSTEKAKKVENVPSEGGTEVKGKKPEVPPAAEPEQAHNEQYYRKHLSELKATLEMHQRELSVLQQKQNLNQNQYYNDPQKTLEQEYSRGEINKLTQEIDAKKQQIFEDEKAIEDLRDQLRREGGDPGWLR